MSHQAAQKKLVFHRPRAPVLLSDHKGEIIYIPCTKIKMNASFHIGTAFLSVTCSFQNLTKYTLDGLFALPCAGSVTSVSISIEDRIFLSEYLPTKDAEAAAEGENGANNESKVQAENPLDQYIPDLFRVPVNGIAAGVSLDIDVDILVPLEFSHKEFHFDFPLSFQQGQARQSLSVTCLCTINCTFPKMSYECDTHQADEIEDTGTFKLLQLKPNSDSSWVTAGDIHLKYTMQNKGIRPTMLHLPASEDMVDERDHFAIVVTPPLSKPTKTAMFRDFVVLLDRSGSMNGSPYSEAIKALKEAFSSFSQDYDRYTMAVFDHELSVYDDGSMMVPTQENIDGTVDWLLQMQPRGGTDIFGPMTWAMEALNVLAKDNIQQDGRLTRLPVILLITDGCVTDEKDIVEAVHASIGHVRLLTFGIGTYCNWYFLKMLSRIGRGSNENVVYADDIQRKMSLLMSYSKFPLLTDIAVELSGVEEVVFYPLPIPDLFGGSPLMVSGQCIPKDEFPEKFSIQGTDIDGIRRSFEADVLYAENVPVDRIFFKQHMDILVAQHWLEQDKAKLKEIVELSCAYGVPSPFTRMVLFESTRQQQQAKEAEKDKEEAPKRKKWAKKSKKRFRRMAIGGAIVIGTGLFVFGDEAATLMGGSGLVDFDNMGIFGDLDGDCCECCGDLCDDLD